MPNVLITGGSRGIGRATALLCAERGWNVAISYVSNRQAAEQTVAGIEAQGARGAAIQGDVSVEADTTLVFDQAEQALGGITHVVVNAGVVAPSMPLAQMDIERLRHVFDINVLGSYLTAREAARRLPQSAAGTGAIVIVSSAAARLGAAFEYVDYAGAKAALDTLTVGLAKELGPAGIRVNAVRPGLIETDIHASGGQPDRAERLGKTSALGRAGRPEEVAQAIVFLLSDASSYTTGAILDTSGGR